MRELSTLYRGFDKYGSPRFTRPSTLSLAQVMVPFKGAREILGVDTGSIFGADVDRFQVRSPIDSARCSPAT